MRTVRIAYIVGQSENFPFDATKAQVGVDFYSKINQMHNISNLFYFGTVLYMFRTVSPSIIRSLRLYIQHQVYVVYVLWLLASGNEEFHLVPASKQPQNLYDINLMLYVQS
jgi:hypothetical protein